MDEFARSLERDIVPEWSQQYLAYGDLQYKVEAAAAQDQHDASKKQRKEDVESKACSVVLKRCNGPDHNSPVALQQALNGKSGRCCPFTRSRSMMYSRMCIS